MPYNQIRQIGLTYGLLTFDKNGNEHQEDRDSNGNRFSAKLLGDIATQGQPTDIFIFCHGWKGDLRAAEDQYNRWMGAVWRQEADRVARGAAFKPMWIGLHWPSLPWGDEEIQSDAFGATDAPGCGPLSPDELVREYADRLGLGDESIPLIKTIVQAHQRDPAATELPPEAANAYGELARRAGRRGEGPSAAPDAEGEPFDPQAAFEAGNQASAGANFGGGDLTGGILGPLRQLSFWTMKKRARAIGESGMHTFLEKLMQAAPNARVHLMGHSFGCIVVCSILGGPKAGRPLPRPVDSVILVQGAVSHWACAAQIPQAKGAGYFNPIIIRHAVRGPIVVTRSIHDRAVGTWYPLACSIGFTNPAFALDLEPENLPKYGAIGAFGIRGLPGVTDLFMLPEAQAYNFEPGKIYNLESSKYIAKGGGASGAHSDIDGPQVAHALWEAARP